MVATLLFHEALRAMFAIVGLGPVACVQILALSLAGWGTSGASSSLTSSPVEQDRAGVFGKGCCGPPQSG